MLKPLSLNEKQIFSKFITMKYLTREHSSCFPLSRKFNFNVITKRYGMIANTKTLNKRPNVRN